MNPLSDLRNEVDRLDEALIDILGQRFRVTQEIGKLKKANSLPPVDAEREKRQVERIKGLARKAGVKDEVALKVLRVIIDEVVHEHQTI